MIISNWNWYLEVTRSQWMCLQIKYILCKWRFINIEICSPRPWKLWWTTTTNAYISCHLFWRHNLTGSVISSFQVLSHQDCHSLCIRHQRCSSHNHQYITISSSQLCELNDTTGKMCPRNMIQKKRFKFYEDCVSWANSYSRHSWLNAI